jgi:hypothetical protein
MKHVLAVALVLNLLLEALAAFTLISGPTGLGAAGALPNGGWSMHYGFAVIAIASASVWLWPRRHELAALTPVLGVLTTFHLGLLISLLIAGDQAGGAAAHAVLSVLFCLSFALRSKIASS